MNLSTLQQETKTLVGNAKMGTAFELLKAHIAPNSNRYNTLMLIKSTYADVSDAGITGTQSYEYLQLGKNQIADKIMRYVDVLEQEDLIVPIASEQADNFLVICPDDQIEKMKEYFTGLQFTGFQVCSYERAIDVSPFKLLVFHNVDIPYCPNEKMKDDFKPEIQELIKSRIAFMNDCLQKKQYAVYYGNTFYWVNGKRDFVHPANSRFALFARVKEMLEYRKVLGS